MGTNAISFMLCESKKRFFSATPMGPYGSTLVRPPVRLSFPALVIVYLEIRTSFMDENLHLN